MCGDPPPGVTLGVVSNDYDLGSYPTLGVYSEYLLPTEYVSACENALQVFDSAVSWRSLKDHFDKSIADSSGSDV